MIPKGEIPAVVLSQPSKPWGVTQTSLPCWPGGGRGGFASGTRDVALGDTAKSCRKGHLFLWEHG